MKTIVYISNLTSIIKNNIILILKSILFFLALYIIKKIGLRIIKHVINSKNDNLYTQKFQRVNYI